MHRKKGLGLQKDGRDRNEKDEQAAGNDSGKADLRGYSRPPLARMQRMHQWLMENRYPNCRKMADEFEVSSKTVQRDMNFMRDRMGLPIEYDRRRFGFRYTSSVTGFPAVAAPADVRRKEIWGRALPGLIGREAELRDGPRRIHVRVCFDKEAARVARNRTWHPTQVLHPLPKGGLEMTLRARDEREIVRWVLSWGAHAWIAEPERLRSLMRDAGRRILAQHQGGNSG